jgi:hypothetical protein
MSRVQQTLYAATGSYTSSLLIAATMLSAGTVLALMLKAPKVAMAPKSVPEGAVFQPGLGYTMADGGEKIKKEEENK